jgi:four helix bundle protein
MQFSFEKLTAWQKSRHLVKSVYSVTKTFPREETFGLTNQLRRAAVSISSNLAEGSARQTNKDRAHFTTMAYTSLLETLNQCIIAHDLGYVSDEDYQKIRAMIEEVGRMLSGLRKTLL